MLGHLKPLIGKLCNFSKQRMGFSHPPKLFLKNDIKNSEKPLGKTAFYDPAKESVTIFISGRHPKDILRSIAHELVHHTQNLRGDLSPDKMNSMSDTYAQDCDHMRNMEKEAYLVGNMCFRDFEDGLEDEDKKLYKLAESRFLKENKTMTTKITNDFLRKQIAKILNEKIQTNEITGLGDLSYEAENKPKLSTLEAEAMVRTMIDMFVDDNDGFGVMQTLNDMGEGELKKGGEKVKLGRGADGLGGRAKAALEQVYSALLMANNRHHSQQSDDPSKTYTDEIGTDPSLTGTDNLEEGGCGDHASPGKRNDNKKSKKKFAANQKPFDKATAKDRAGPAPDSPNNNNNARKKKEKKTTDESKIQTPEQENTLYEQRFTPKNNRLFEKLIKDWTK